MRRPLVFALVALLAFAAFGVSGCNLFDNPTQDANNAIGDANGHFQKYQVSSDVVAKLAGDLNGLDPLKKAENAKGIEEIAQIRTQLDEQRSQLTQASAALKRVGTFKVDAKLKKYAELEIAAVSAEVAVVDAGVTYYTDMNRLFTAIRDKKDTPKSTAQLLTDIQKATANIQQLSDEAAKAKDTADAYFTQLGSQG